MQPRNPLVLQSLTVNDVFVVVVSTGRGNGRGKETPRPRPREAIAETSEEKVVCTSERGIIRAGSTGVSSRSSDSEPRPHRRLGKGRVVWGAAGRERLHGSDLRMQQLKLQIFDWGDVLRCCFCLIARTLDVDGHTRPPNRF